MIGMSKYNVSLLLLLNLSILDYTNFKIKFWTPESKVSLIKPIKIWCWFYYA
jgi:hypothetical protein